MAGTTGPNLLVQPTFDGRIRKYHSPLGTDSGGLQRGYMIWDMPGGPFSPSYAGGVFGDGRDIINFLYNPSTISSDYNIANGSLQAGMMYPLPGTSGQLVAPLQQTVSWQLYYDRTYELNYGTNGGNGTGKINDPAIIGCQADVLQFMQFTGMLYSQVSTLTNLLTAGSSGSSGSALSTSATPGELASALGSGGIVMMVPCWVYFGNAYAQQAKSSSQNINSFNTQLAYYGFLQEWTVQYTHFNENMIPVRCVISVNFTMLPTPTQSAGLTTDITALALGQANNANPANYTDVGLGGGGGNNAANGQTKNIAGR